MGKISVSLIPWNNFEFFKRVISVSIFTFPLYLQLICFKYRIILNTKNQVDNKNQSYQEETNMSDKMFCFQCEQTAGCAGCTGSAGVCGKTADTAKLQDQLTGALIGLARSSRGKTPSESSRRAMIEGLFTTITNVSFDEERIREQIENVKK